MNRTFDFYEYAGIIIPGAVLILGLIWLFPEGRAVFAKDGVTLGEFGLFVIIAYAAGHLIQAVGNFIEWAWWKIWGCMPTAQVLAGKHISGDQHRRILDAVRSAGISSDPHIEKLPCADRLAIAREVYSIVSAGKRASRVDTFNGNYGLMRGMAAAIVIIGVAAIAAGKGLLVAGVLTIMLVLALQRMHRFGKHYAIELFVQFLGASGQGEGGDQPG
jgi:hypothetical protein